MTVSGNAYDVVMVTDCRFPGGTTASLVEEIIAQRRAGYRTAVVHVAGPTITGALGFNPKLRDCLRRGWADLRFADETLRARLLVLRHPAVFTQPLRQVPKVNADVRLLAMNQAPRDTSQSEPFYDVRTVDDRIAEAFGGRFTWAPIGPLVRRCIGPDASHVEVGDRDWTNIVDLDAWALDRRRFADGRPVIGRHSRPSWRKWPETADEILAAYPDRPDMIVRVLGGVVVPERILGRIPETWDVYAFNTLPIREFLRRIDFFVYFHHHGTVEAFGRAILEAVASGAVSILPRHFSELFGDACLYGTPFDVQRIVAELYADKAAYDTQSAAGQEYVRERFSYQTHATRVAELVGAPSLEPVTEAPASTRRRALVSTPPTPAAPRRVKVMFLSSNGVGVGHLMRLMAIARRASERIEPIFFTLSQAVSVVRGMGFPVEYMPSSGYTQVGRSEWNAWFRKRFGEAIAAHAPAAVVFDGTWPYKGLLQARADNPATRFVWSRRAMWKPAETGEESLRRASAFDLVIEPGEFAADADPGPTRAVPDSEVTRVAPIMLLDPDELLAPEPAIAELGLDPDRPAALVQLGAGNINDLSSTVSVVLRRLLAEADLQVCVTKSIIAGEATAAAGEIVTLAGVYPLARYLRAFDFAVGAAGYNTFHEFVGYALPSILVPNTETMTDDQLARATYAEQAGVALCALGDDPAGLEAALGAILEPERRAAMRERARTLFAGNGAADAMAAIEALVLAEGVTA